MFSVALETRADANTQLALFSSKLPFSHSRSRTSLLLCSVTTAEFVLGPYELKVKTCNATNAGTAGQLLLSFCKGDDLCPMGPANAYNSDAELDAVGTWNTLKVPLAFEPTAMSMAIVGDDAW